MAWTSHLETLIRCGEDPGPLAPGELVARLIHARNSEPYQDMLMRKDFFPPTGGRQISNDCGLSDGFSVDRCGALTDEDLRIRSAAQAAKQPGRESTGALIAHINELRAIRKTEAQGDQVVFAYDDPITGQNREHCVLRVRADTSRVDWPDVRDKIRKAFRIRVTP